MAADCAIELRKHNVAFISLWPGAVQTENLVYLVNNDGWKMDIPNVSLTLIVKFLVTGKPSL